MPEGLVASELDARIFAGSLGRICRNKPEDFPRSAFLVADPDRRKGLRARLDALGPGKKIGVMWRGGVGGNEEDKRSMDLVDMTRLLEKGRAEGVHWISLNHLQSGREETDRLFKDTGIRVHHWPEIIEAQDYDETAALLAELDVVVSVTGTVAHCAGALGVKTHVLVSYFHEWRYAAHHDGDMLWYGTMALHRQSAEDRDAWPLDEIAQALCLG
jgi:hypothetical protein